jgi:hypothetical protein
MLAVLMHFRAAWNDYFTGNATLCESQTYGTRQTLSDTNVHVLNCLFRSITSSTSDGGALYCYNSTMNILIESTSFFTCKTSSQHGGAIYFYKTGCQCVLHEVCGYDCCSTNTSDYTSSQFARIDVNNTITHKNYVNYSSIVRCVSENSKSHQTLRLFNGKICCLSVNLSMNKCDRYLFHCYPSNDTSSVTYSFSYSSFADNNVTGYSCIHLNMALSNHEIKSCNIIRNTQNSDSDGIIVTSGNLNIYDSCILENTAKYIFYQGQYTYRITLSNCTVDKTTNNQNLVIQNTVTKSIIHGLNHMSTLNCNAVYDAVGTLTPFKSPRYLCTCGKIFYYPRQQDLFYYN